MKDFFTVAGGGDPENFWNSDLGNTPSRPDLYLQGRNELPMKLLHAFNVLEKRSG